LPSSASLGGRFLNDCGLTHKGHVSLFFFMGVLAPSFPFRQVFFSGLVWNVLGTWFVGRLPHLVRRLSRMPGLMFLLIFFGLPLFGFDVWLASRTMHQGIWSCLATLLLRF